MNFLKALKKRTIITSIIYLAAGLVLVVFPQITGEVICLSLGVLASAVALMYLLTFFRNRKNFEEQQSDLISACLWASVALFTFLRQDVLLSLVPIVLGFAILINGVLKLNAVLQARHNNNDAWVFFLFCALAQVGAGFFFIVDPFKVAVGLTVVFGVVLLFAGATDLISLLVLRSKEEPVQNITDVEVQEVAPELLPPRK